MFQSSKIRNKQSSLLQHKVSLFFLYRDTWQWSSGKYYLFCDEVHSLSGKLQCLGIFQRKNLFGQWMVFKILVKWLRPLKEIPGSRVQAKPYCSWFWWSFAECWNFLFEMANASLLFLSVDCANKKKVSPLGMESFSSQNIQYHSCSSLKRGSWKKSRLLKTWEKLWICFINHIFS